MVDAQLFLGIEATQRVENLRVDGVYCVTDTFSAVACAAVAQFDRLMRASRRTGRHRRTAERAVFQRYVDLDGRIAAAVENFAGGDVDDGGHLALPD